MKQDSNTTLSKTLVDISLLNALDSDRRPERSLDDIARILGVGNLDKPLRDGHRFESPSDPLLHKYNAGDTFITVLECAELEKRIGAIDSC